MASFRSAVTLALAVASTVNAHSFFHKAIVGGVDQGQLFGVRAPSSNSPIQDVTSSAITCNSGLVSPVSKDVISVAPGDSFGMQWNHNLAGPTAGDADDPIAASHKGPVMAYMAKVSDASTNDGSGLSWFKVAEEGFDTTTRKWGVDTLIANAGLWSFTMPDLAPGDYLLRGEIIALHSAGSSGGAQFYMSCVNIRVTGSGTCSPTSTVSFPGAYSASDPGILISIYGATGQPDNNGGKPYTIPGPPVAVCGSSSAPTKASSSSMSPSASSTSVAATSKPSPSTKVTTTSTTPSISSTPVAASSKPTMPHSSYSWDNSSIPWPTYTAVTPTSSSSSSSVVTAKPTTKSTTTTTMVWADWTTTTASPVKPTTSKAVPTTPLPEEIDSDGPPEPSLGPTNTKIGVVSTPSSSPVAAISTSVAKSSSTAPVSFTSTVTGRIGKPTKFTCYVEEW